VKSQIFSNSENFEEQGNLVWGLFAFGNNECLRELPMLAVWYELIPKLLEFTAASLRIWILPWSFYLESLRQSCSWKYPNGAIAVSRNLKRSVRIRSLPKRILSQICRLSGAQLSTGAALNQFRLIVLWVRTLSQHLRSFLYEEFKSHSDGLSRCSVIRGICLTDKDWRGILFLSSEGIQLVSTSDW
jgi:hypothetical protein